MTDTISLQVEQTTDFEVAKHRTCLRRFGGCGRGREWTSGTM